MKYLKIVGLSFLSLIAFVVMLVLTLYLLAPVYTFEDEPKFEGHVIYNPYKNIDPDAWRKGNFHAHQKEKPKCDYTVDEFISRFREWDYDIITLSDHLYINRERSKRSGFLPSYEHGYNVNKIHFGVLGATEVSWKDVFFHFQKSHPQSVINELKQRDVKVVLNHPYRSTLPQMWMKSLRGYDMIEQYFEGWSDICWDLALSSGIYSTLTVSNDAHSIDMPANLHQRIFTMVNTKRIVGDSIINRLYEGAALGYYVPFADHGTIDDFGPILSVKNIGCKGETVFIKLDQDVKMIEFIGNHGIVRVERNTDYAEYNFADDDEYIRMKVYGNDGTMILSNPFVRTVDGQRPTTELPSVNYFLTILQTIVILSIFVFAFMFFYKKNYMNVLRKRSWFMPLLIIAGAIFMFVPGLGSVHLFDWDELNFAESAREMILTGDYLNVKVNFEPFWEKPPFFIWLQVLSMKVFGIGDFAARFPNVICGIVTLISLFYIGKREKNSRFGMLWVLMYAGSLFPFFFFKSGIIDPWFNLFIFTGLYFFIRFIRANKEKDKYVMLSYSALLLGIAVLTKGPVAILIFTLTFIVYFIYNKFKINANWKHVIYFALLLTFVSSFWFILQILNGNYKVIEDFIVYQIRLFQTEDAGHGGFLFYHFVMVFIGLFPSSIFALPTFKFGTLNKEQNLQTRDTFRWMQILFWVVIILFTIVKTKIVHYSSLTYFPLTFMAAWFVEMYLQRKENIAVYQKVLIVLMGSIFGAAVAIVPFFDRFKHLVIPHVDEFTAGNLQAMSSFTGFEVLVGLIMFFTIIVYFIVKKNSRTNSIIALFIGTMCFVSTTMIVVVPQVEKYTQLVVIEFYKSKAEEDCYIYPLNKSYAHYFYAEFEPESNNADFEYLAHGDIDKDTYFVARDIADSREFMENTIPDAQIIKQSNGFAFYIRTARTIHE